MNTKTALFFTVAVIMMASAYATSCSDHSDCSESAPFCISQTCSPCHALRHPFDDTLCDTLIAGSRCFSNGACATSDSAKRVLDDHDDGDDEEEDETEEETMEEEEMMEENMEENNDEENMEEENMEENNEEGSEEEGSEEEGSEEEEGSDSDDEESDEDDTTEEDESTSGSIITVSVAALAAVLAF